MSLDKTKFLTSLSSVTADLQPATGTSSQQLEKARVAVAQAFVAGQVESPTHVSGVGPTLLAQITSDQQSVLESTVDSALAQPQGVARFLVARREQPLAATGLASLTPDWAAGRAVDSTLGPFTDSLGRLVWIDVFNIVSQFRLVRSPSDAPFLTIPLRGVIAAGTQFMLPAGSIWIASQQLAASTPTGSYTGLLIKGGTLTFSQSLTPLGDEIVVPSNVTCTLSLQLDPGLAPSGSGAGEDARRSEAGVPKTVTFVFSLSGARIQSVGNASLGVYGYNTKINPTTSQPIYVAAVARIFVPASVEGDLFSPVDVRSDEFQPSGKAAIESAAWSLPVAVVSPDSLGNAVGAGGVSLILKDGLALSWKGQKTAVPAGSVTLIVEPGLITVVALAARSLGASEIIPLWSKKLRDPASSQIELSWPSQFPLRYFSSSSGTELLLFSGSLAANFDRPVTVMGNRVFIKSEQALIVFVESGIFKGVLVEASLDPPPASAPKALAFAIANAVFRTTPARTLLLVAANDGVQSPQGGVAIGFGLQYLLPILPDPYATNINVPYDKLGDIGTIGPLTAIVVWTPANLPVLSYLLPQNAASTTTANIANRATGSPVGAVATASEVVAPVPLAEVESGALVLLDLSTNVDQFGVAWRSGRQTTGVAGSSLAVESMFLESQSDSIYILTLPAVEWEPVFTESAPPFPSPVTFPDSGGPTSIIVQSVQLVRLAPAPALDFLVADFTTSPTPQPAAARLTLPFGIEAFSTWIKPEVSGSKGAIVDYNRPQFTAESVKGGYQISVRAVDPGSPDSPSLQGYTIQLRNALFSGVAANKSVLDDQVDTIFNGYLGPGKFRPQVPVTRLDVSGYGESLFSHWLNNTDDAVAVSQAHFDVLIGRTSVEVIQVRSVLYPYGVRVVRTITINRKNSGVVVRKDSGWQAVSDGEYLFPGVGLTTHPGVVRKISEVTNIRDTGQFIDVGGGAQVAGVLFDGYLDIDNAVKGVSNFGVPARDQIGYVQLTPASSGCLTQAQYQELINKTGPLGGTVDCVLNVGGSGQLMKLGRVGVGVTQGMSGSEFVMTAWGSPQFPQGGQWSFLRQTGVGTAPEVVDKDLGVPLIRAGPAPAAPPLSSPYRFADPVDLATPDTPASDYGIVHATGTQRVFFPRPKVEATAPDRITSTRPPVLADPYSMANSVGYFPRTDSAIPFPDANYALVISGGNFKLQLPSPSFPVTVGQRTIAEAAGVRSFADYSGSTAMVAIDTSAPVPWAFELKNVAAAMSSTSMGELMRVVGDFKADANTPSNLKNSNVIFGGALGVVQDVMKFLQQLGFPTPMSVTMTNSPLLKIALKIPMDDELNTLMPPCGPHFEDMDVTVGLEIDLKNGKSAVEFEAGGTIFLPTQFSTCAGVPPELTGLQAVGLLKFGAKISTDFGQIFILTIGAGVGVTFKLAGFKVVAYYVNTQFLILGDVIGLGVGALLKGTIDLKFIEIDVSIEAKMAVLKVNQSSTCSDVTVWADAQVTFAIEVTIAFIIDIEFQVQSEWKQNLNGGPCDLPDVL